MAITEVFVNPTVKQVIFEIRYPNLFYIESKIGVFQISILDKFPKSAVVTQKDIFIGELPANQDSSIDQTDSTTRIWQFRSDDDSIVLSIRNNSLSITSKSHKTYNNPASENKFRDIVEFVLKNFFEFIKLPIIHRLGLRYIDECPVIKNTNDSYSEYYNSGFNLARFNLSDSLNMELRNQFKIDEYIIIYKEAFKILEGKPFLILDFDGAKNNLKSEDILNELDNIHIILSNEYKKSIKQPVIDYMKTGINRK